MDELIAQTKFGKRGANVTNLQKELQRLGFFPAAQKTTGYYGAITRRAVKKYQNSL
ncbi:MAG: peptidoglycan-binding domain-containing protein [Candidatus Uhrbacteria bacterium]